MAVEQRLEKNRKNRIRATVREEVKQQAPNYYASSPHLILKAGLIFEGWGGGRIALFRVRAQSGRVGNIFLNLHSFKPARSSTALQQYKPLPGYDRVVESVSGAMRS